MVFRANRTVSGTWPPGSQWTRNPIPACAKPDGGAFDLEAHCVAEGGATQFPAPGPGGWITVSDDEVSRNTIFREGVHMDT